MPQQVGLAGGDPEGEHIKTTFARYAAAMYCAALLEEDLVQAFAVSKIVEAKDAETLIRDPWNQGYKRKLHELITHVA